MRRAVAADRAAIETVVAWRNAVEHKVARKGNLAIQFFAGKGVNMAAVVVEPVFQRFARASVYQYQSRGDGGSRGAAFVEGTTAEAMYTCGQVAEVEVFQEERALGCCCACKSLAKSCSVPLVAERVKVLRWP